MSIPSHLGARISVLATASLAVLLLLTGSSPASVAPSLRSKTEPGPGSTILYLTSTGKAILTREEQAHLAAAIACLATVPSPNIRTTGSLREVYATGVGSCSADAPTGVTYRLHVQQFNGSTYVNQGTVGKVSLPPGGGPRSTTAYSTCGVTLSTTWRSYGQFYKNGLPVGTTLPGNGVTLLCS